jgi:hypothetical protein
MITSSKRVCWIRDGKMEKITSGAEYEAEESKDSGNHQAADSAQQ